MKKTKRLLAGLLALLLVLTGAPMYGGMEVQAEGAMEEGDYQYTVNDDGESVAITKYIGEGGEVTVPSTLGGMKVTKIGGYEEQGVHHGAFWSCHSVTKVTVPEGITSIGDSAFWPCHNLTEVSIPSSVESIGKSAFSYCTSLREINIPDGIESIEESTFEGCSSLMKVNIPSSVTSIGAYAFRSCTNLTEINIPDGVTALKEGVFIYCEGLTGIAIPSSVTSIGDSAFSGCNGLTKVDIPSSVTSIGNSAFYGCGSITGMDIPSSVTSIGTSIFASCNQLNSISVEEGNPSYDSRKNCNAIIETATNTLVAGCNVTEIPLGTASIGASAFKDCSVMKEISIPDSVTSIGEYAFEGCSSLTGFTIPISVDAIGREAFWGCSSITEVVLPSNVTKVGVAIFNRCSSLTSIKVEEGNQVYDSREGCNAIVETATNTLVAGCNCTVIPDGIASIGESALFFCDGITEINLPSSVTTIDEYAFSGCNGLIKVDIPASVTSIGRFGFMACKNLTEITIPASVTSIGDYAFNACSPDLTIYGEAGSEAQRYADRNSIKFQPTSGEEPEPPKTSLSQATVTLEKDSFTYTGKRITPAVTVTLDGKTLAIGTDYNVFYKNNISIGTNTARVTVMGTGSYTGKVEKRFSIIKKEEDGSKEEPSQGNPSQSTVTKTDISKAAMALEKDSYPYTGKPITPAVSITLNGKKLTLGTDYTVAYADNTKAGTAKATATGKGDYTGSITKTFTITQAGSPAGNSPSQGITCKKKTYTVVYGAKPFNLKVTSGKKLTFKSSAPKVASVSPKGKVTVKGTGIASITAKSSVDSVKITVKVSPKKPAVKSVKALKGRKLTAAWAKDKMATGYQVQLSSSKNFKKVAKNQRISKNTYTFRKLKAGKKYYIRIRSYKKSGKATLYSVWSKPKQSGKVKK